jgi:hypothetical protein
MDFEEDSRFLISPCQLEEENVALVVTYAVIPRSRDIEQLRGTASCGKLHASDYENCSGNSQRLPSGPAIGRGQLARGSAK